MTPEEAAPGGPADAGPPGAPCRTVGVGSAAPGWWRSALRTLLGTAVAAAATACATAPSPPPTPGPGPGDAPGPAPEEADAARRTGSAALDEVARSVEAGSELGAAAARADSVYFRVRGRPELAGTAARALAVEARALERAGEPRAAARRLEELLSGYPSQAPEDAARRLARLRIELGDDPGAVGALLRRPGPADDSAFSLLRRAARAMSVRELRGELEGATAETGPGPLRGAVLAELAVAEARAGEEAAARSSARAALEADPRGPDRERARSVLEGRVAPRRGPVRVGLLLPLSGRFSAVSDRIRQGVELALRHGTGEGGPGVQLVTEDAEPTGPALRRSVESLEEQGVVAILGPVRSGRLAEVAGARSDGGLLVLSPTATQVGTAAPSLLTLWAHLRREVDAALALGRWLGGTLEGSAVGAVFPDEETGRRAFLAFRRALGGTGAWLAASSPYAPGATTLEEPITSVAAFEPRAVFAPGGETASILQMAPQLSYYGIRGAVVAGGPAWSAPSTVRRLEPSFSQYRVLTTFVDREEGRWSEFQASYEKTYRTSLHGNMLPALGHDAALLVLTALRDVSPPRPRAVARRVAALEGVEGASGRLTPDPATGTVARRVLLRSLRDRELAPVTRAEVRSWLASAGRLETVRVRTRRRRAIQAVEASGIRLEPGGGG